MWWTRRGQSQLCSHTRGEKTRGHGSTRVRSSSIKDYNRLSFGQKVMIMKTLKILGALTMVATVGSTVVISTYPQTAHAQTQGGERRDERRDTRQTSRDVKQACKAGDEKSRAECRQGKHEVKQTGRQGESPTTNPAKPATNAPH